VWQNTESVCFEIVPDNWMQISMQWIFKFKDFSRTFKHLIGFYVLFKALNFLSKIQAFTAISQARYESQIKDMDKD